MFQCSMAAVWTFVSRTDEGGPILRLYLACMDDLTSAIFYSTWNQAVAATVQRHPDLNALGLKVLHLLVSPLFYSFTLHSPWRYSHASLNLHQAPVKSSLRPTSLKQVTIPGIYYVVDPGFAKKNTYNERQVWARWW
jgi:hypothetical protein